MAYLRKVAAAQEQLRESGDIDRNGNGSGEHGFLDDLKGGSPKSGEGVQGKLPERISPSGKITNGVMTVDDYCFQVFLLSAKNQGVAAGDATPPDGGSAEVLWFAYAWPASSTSKGKRAFFVDQSAQVSICRTDLRYCGNSRPNWDAAFAVNPDLATGADVTDQGRSTGSSRRGRDGQLWQYVAMLESSVPSDPPRRQVVPLTLIGAEVEDIPLGVGWTRCEQVQLSSVKFMEERWVDNGIQEQAARVGAAAYCFCMPVVPAHGEASRIVSYAVVSLERDGPEIRLRSWYGQPAFAEEAERLLLGPRMQMDPWPRLHQGSPPKRSGESKSYVVTVSGTNRHSRYNVSMLKMLVVVTEDNKVEAYYKCLIGLAACALIDGRQTRILFVSSTWTQDLTQWRVLADYDGSRGFSSSECYDAAQPFNALDPLCEYGTTYKVLELTRGFGSAVIDAIAHK